MTNKTTKWLYIAGRGHSGSTVLDAMLGNAPGIESVGEIIPAMTRYEAKCSCGVKFQDCKFWENVRNRFEERSHTSWNKAALEMQKQSHIMYFPKTVFASSGNKWVQNLKRYSEYIADAVCNDKCIIVDSSKEITRALFMIRFLDEAKVIHLIKHPAQITQSNYFRFKNNTGLIFLRLRFKPKKYFAPFLLLSCIGWIFGNLLSEIVRLFDNKSFLRIRYEDLTNDPIKELERIEKMADISLKEVKTKIINKQMFYVGHNIGGNHMRMKGSFVFDSSRGKRNILPKYYKIMVYMVCWPMLLFYGYINFRK